MRELLTIKCQAHPFRKNVTVSVVRRITANRNTGVKT